MRPSGDIAKGTIPVLLAATPAIAGPVVHPWTDALKTRAGDGTTFLVSKEWRAIDGGAAASDASDQKLVWLLVK